MVGQVYLSGHCNFYIVVPMLVLLLVFGFSETVVRKPNFQRALGLVRSTKWQKHKAIVF